MSQQKIRASELVVSLILFEVGSTTLFLQGGGVKQNAWIAVLGAGAAGALVLLLHLAIHRRDPRLDLFLLFHRYMGPWVGTVFNLGFIAYFAYEMSRNLRDMGELTMLTLLPGTRIWITALITLLVVANTVRHDWRVSFLTGMALFPIMVASYLILILIIFLSGLIHYEFLLPVLENGVNMDMAKEVMKLVSFPFGETVVFLVFYPLIQQRRSVVRNIMISYFGIVLFLAFINQLSVMVLGPVLAANTTLPLLETVQLVQFPGVFERMDALFTLILFMGLGFKMVYFYSGAVIGLERVTGIGYRKWIIPLGALIFWAAFWSPNYTHHIWLGREIVLFTIWPVFQIVLPALLFTVMLLRRNKIKPH
ncbi:GerAB/ArcD/ProY family transporter [Paenibacillus pinistramenti]|uniref:GerAB/ArcD/ProY family transporter n=1 Tax=Paenibacillus pinistramenti TaxID=1768003 RepID=UPI0011083D3F|nr:GerAB/ArcD/ProY family transporter [Paenibacillus pinistramenti]